MSNEVIEFGESIGATDLSMKIRDKEYQWMFKRRNYFQLTNNTYLIIKISKNKIRPFWGVGKQFIEFFNMITATTRSYWLVLLVSNKSGWVFGKSEINSYIEDGSWSYSEKQKQYKINIYNLKDQNSFTSSEALLRKLGYK